MIIKEQKPITLAEAQSLVTNLDEKKELKAYFKEYTPLKKEKALELIKEITDLNNPKLRPSDITKIADFLPESSEELNKISTELSLTEEESNAILDIVKKYRK